MHTKLWLIDRTHVYVGSANMDWRSLTQVKELGLLAMNCSCIARDIGKIFDVSFHCLMCEIRMLMELKCLYFLHFFF